MSEGGYGSSQTLHAALEYATGNDIPVVVSIGNDDRLLAQYPAAYPEAIAVGATQEADERATPFSWGGGSNYHDTLEMVAPGDEIWGLSTINGDYSYFWSGTSQAAPHVAGVAALLRSLEPTLTRAEVLQYLIDGAQDGVGDPSEDVAGWDRYYGHGRLDAAASLSLLGVDIADADQDGVTIRDGDCDDDDDATYPGAPELADQRDNDCDGEIDEGLDTGDTGQPAPPDPESGCGCGSPGGLAVAWWAPGLLWLCRVRRSTAVVARAEECAT